MAISIAIWNRYSTQLKAKMRASWPTVSRILPQVLNRMRIQKEPMRTASGSGTCKLQTKLFSRKAWPSKNATKYLVEKLATNTAYMTMAGCKLTIIESMEDRIQNQIVEYNETSATIGKG
jgi:hypothetical protein